MPKHIQIWFFHGCFYLPGDSLFISSGSFSNFCSGSSSTCYRHQGGTERKSVCVCVCAWFCVLQWLQYNLFTSFSYIFLFYLNSLMSTINIKHYFKDDLLGSKLEYTMNECDFQLWGSIFLIWHPISLNCKQVNQTQTWTISICKQKALTTQTQCSSHYKLVRTLYITIETTHSCNESNYPEAGCNLFSLTFLGSVKWS